MPDLLVIGAGLAGLVAALTAAQAGLSVRVIAKGMGALHWSAGTVDVLGYSPHGEPVMHPVTEAAALPSPHPYALACAERLADTLAWFRTEIGLAGAIYASAESAGVGSDANTWLPSPVGARRPAYLVPDAQLAGDLSDGKPVVIAGMQGMRDFYPELIAANLTKQGIAARAVHVPVDAITERVDFNTVHLAQALDRPDTTTQLAAAIAGLVRPGEKVGLPAIIGLQYHAATMAELRSAVRAEVFEIPTLPPSVPGIRLHRALCSRLEACGVRVETGMDVIGFHAENGEIRWVETETSARPLRHRARAFLLATGGILGGGFTGEVGGRLVENVFNLPLAAPENRDAWFRSEFLDPRGQPVFQAGIEVGDRFQPADAAGQPMFRNLWAAGGVLAHADPIRERSLEGLAIASGRNAALAVIAQATNEQAVT